MNKIKTALISVWDKSNIIQFANFLTKNDIRIISTGGTKNILNENNIDVVSIREITEQKEVMDGRLKTLHPKIFGGILADKNNKNHINDLNELMGTLIDLVVVNLYPFKTEAIDKELELSKAIEYIDIGGPSMLRAAAKNYLNVVPLCNPSDYKDFMNLYNMGSGFINEEQRVHFAKKVFGLTSEYENNIYKYFNKNNCKSVMLNLNKEEDLRYGENPHQNAAFYLPMNETKKWNQLHGKSLSYNNYYDIETASSIVSEFNQIACAIIKHSNPCGFAIGKNNLKETYLSAVQTDPISFFGGIVAFNKEINLEVAIELNKSFLECIVAPSFSKNALIELKKKKNLRLIIINMAEIHLSKFPLIKSVFNGFLIQDKDIKKDEVKNFKIVSKIKPNNNQLKALYLGWNLVKYVKSNAIVLSNDKQLVGVGAGQMSRIDSVKIAINKAKENNLKLKDTIMASDAFFPFPDCVQLAAEEGVSGVIQPGGSIKDNEVIEEINKQEMFMVITNKRHFYH